MFNELKIKFAYNNVKRNYTKVLEVEDIEEVYYLKNKLVVVVNNEEIGSVIYDIVRSLKEKEEVISTNNMAFKVQKYISDKQNRIYMIFIDVNFEVNYDELSEIEKLYDFISFIIDIENKGYYLNALNFQSEKCECISTFLSLFSLDSESISKSKRCLIKHIHYVLSNGINFEEYYEKVCNEVIFKVNELPYTLPIVTMCYNCFCKNVIYTMEEILDILERAEQYKNITSRYLVVNVENITLTEIEKNEKYVIYDGNIKIYHNISENFKEFLKYYDKYDRYEKDSITPIEQSDEIIIDFNGNIIGYKFSEKDANCTNKILAKELKNQYQIFNFIVQINSAIKCISRRTGNSAISDCNNNFSIEEDLVLYNDNLVITKMEKLFEFMNTDKNILKNQIVSIFFKIYLKFFNEKYGELKEEKEILAKKEVRFLSPIVAKNFINYVLEKSIEYEEIYEEIFSSTRKISYEDNNSEIYLYDAKFEYDPIKTPFIFDYEAEKKYGIKIENGMTTQLDDDRKLIIFKRKKKISNFKNRQEDLYEQLREKLNMIEDEHIKIVEISEIIYSKSINNDNMYKMVGYVTNPIKGTMLTEEKLLSFSNKDLFKAIAYFFKKMGKYYIPLQNIWMDDDFTFYINILEDDFKMGLLDCSKYDHFDPHQGFIEYFIENLLAKGYNPNFLTPVSPGPINTLLSVISNNIKYLYENENCFDAYCPKHELYYRSDCMCPACKRSIYILPYDFKEDIIFEDAYAKHYQIDDYFNLKLYKENTTKELENTIDSLISRRLNNELEYGYFPKEDSSSEDINFIQECFMPYKKAVAKSDGKFIGYIYKAVDFDVNKGTIDIRDIHNMRSLPRLKLIIRLILQIKELTDNNLGFTKNPFTNVFVVKDCKKQVQIVNIEYLSKNANVKDTIKWTYKYIANVLALDDAITINIKDDTTSLDSLVEKLEAFLEDMTKYCRIHNIYYSNKNIFCPKCVGETAIKDIEMETEKQEKITSKEHISLGGEAIIYPYGKHDVAKVFNVYDDYKNLILYKILCKKQILDELNNKADNYKYVIPKKLLIDSKSKNIFGYTMERVEGLPIYVLRDKNQVTELGITMKDVLKILITVGKCIEELHTKANIFIGDLNNRNILFDSNKKVYFLDFDGMGIDDISLMNYTDGFIDPISIKNHNITMKDDWYSFAIQAFYYLTFTHPFNGIFYAIDESTGNEIRLDVVEKMERRISLLGNHAMVPPKIANNWSEWMDEELKTAFLNIFEGDNRESIVPYLIKQYKMLYNEEPFSTIIKKFNVNSKLTATQVTPFKADVTRIINYYSAVCFENGYCVCILVGNGTDREQYNVNFPECDKINNILLWEKTAIAIYPNKVIAIDLKTNTQIYSEEILGIENACFNDNILYFTGMYNKEAVIFQRKFTSNGEVKKDTIKFLGSQKTKAFLAKFNSKFVLVKASNCVDEIYCNSEKLCDIEYSNSEVTYNIIYDDTTKLWLVVNSEGNGIIINSEGYERINITEGISETNIGNISFRKRKIYIPNQNFLYIINVKDQSKNKNMEFNTIMTPKTKFYSINTDGFSVIANNKLYEVCRAE